MSAPTGQYLDNLGITLSIGNGVANAPSILCNEAMNRFCTVENAPEDGNDGAWTLCESQRITELLISEDTAMLKGGCYRAERRKWTNQRGMPQVIRVWGIFPATPATVAAFLLSSTKQSDKGINPKFTLYEKTQTIDLTSQKPALDSTIKDAFYVYLQIDTEVEKDAQGRPLPDQVSGLKPLDAQLFMHHRVMSGDGSHLILTTSAYHGKHEETSARVRALSYIDYQTLQPVTGPNGATWTRFATGNVAVIPGIDPSKALTAQLRGSIQRCVNYVEPLRVMPSKK